MPTSAKVFYPRPLSPPWSSRFRRFSASSAFSIACLIFGIAGFLFGSISLSRPMIGRRKCADFEPLSVSVAWDRGAGSKLVTEERTDLIGGAGVGGSVARHKVMGFVGIQTGFGSVGRRRSLRKTWFPSDRASLFRLEESTGLAFRFVIGKTNDKSKMAALKREIEEYDDFILLDTEEEYSKLPYKTLAFFKAAYALFDSDFYVKADDDIYLRPDRLSVLLAKERPHPQTYLGCMKKGPVFTDPNLKWFEPLSYLLGKEYFLHAYGPIYALSADVVATLVTLRNDRRRLTTTFSSSLKQVVYILIRVPDPYHHELFLPSQYHGNSKALSHMSFRMFSNEDVTIGSWMLAMNVNHENNHELCAPDCTTSSVAVWDIPKCSGLCNPEVKMLELHEREICSGGPTSASDG